MAVIANRIVVGADLNNPLFVFENPQIKEVTSDTAVSLVGEELYIDQFTPTVEYDIFISYFFSPSDYLKFKSSDGKVLLSFGNADLRRLPYGTKITFFSDSRIVGEFFSKKVDRIGKSLFKINAMSAIGLLDKQYHNGGIYMGQFFPAVLSDILGPDIEHVIDPDVPLASQRVFGWLPYDTRRNNLYQLLFAYGVNIVRNSNGKMLFTYIQDNDPVPIPDSRVFSGGSVTYNDPASVVEVIEHSYRYIKNVEEVTLFDNSSEDYMDHAFVTFNEPIYPDSIRWKENEDENIDVPVECYIHETGVNYAIVSGLGQLVGKPYTHTTSVISAVNSDSDVEKIVRVENATLITILNSENVLARLSEYYFHATVVNQDLMCIDEKVGNRYRLKNSFGELFTGYISKMSSRVSSFIRSSCEIIQGYTPVGMGSNYDNEAIIPINPSASSSSLRWTIPASVYEKEKPIIRVVLIGKGEDGSSGQPGRGSNNSGWPGGADEWYPTPYYLYPTIPSDEWDRGLVGGIGGSAGRGGKILSITIDVSTTAVTELRFSYANSGNSNVDLYRSGSLSSSYSSSSGKSASAGFYDPFTGIIYALPGAPGIAGAKGGDGGRVYSEDISSDETSGKSGEDVIYENITYHGGHGSSARTFYEYSEWGDQLIYVVAGGGGGGAAYGTNAQDCPRRQNPADVPSSSSSLEGGPGANAAAPEPTSSVYGTGGNGGHGGGGAGGGSKVLDRYTDYNGQTENSESMCSPGDGGTASQGTVGQYGCAIIYY